MTTVRHDAILMEILQEKQTVVGFLQSVFGFLSRCTDFYHEMKTKDDNVGFPPGFKEQLVFQVIKQFEVKIKNSFETIPPATNEIEVVTEEIINEDIANIQNTPMETETQQIQEVNETKDKNKNIECNDIVQKNKANENFQQNEFYNGAKFDNYCWSQTVNDIEIHIILPPEVLSSKDLKITLNSDEIKIFNNKSKQIILEGKLYLKCKNNDAVWSISENKLQINLDKIKPNWWHKLLLKENTIDLSKMDCSRSLHDLPLEEQVSIEKLQWDHHQKMLGLPTSEDIKNREMLKLAWDAEGSPFKGKPFDPSVVKFD